MKNLNRSLIVLALVLAITGLAFGQAAVSTTTLTNAVSGSITTPGQCFAVGSTTGMYGPGVPISQGGIGTPSTPAAVSLLMVDREVMQINSVPSTTQVCVERGSQGTRKANHLAATTVYFGPASYFPNYRPTGSCTAATLRVLPFIDFIDGEFWTCPTVGPNANIWTKQGTTDSYTFTDGVFYVPPEACFSATSGTAGSGNNTIVIDGSVPALKSSSTNAVAGTSTFTCNFQFPSARLTANKGVSITDITYLYSVQTTTATSMTASTFKSFTGPVPSASETASSATLVDQCNTCVQTPAVASANLTAVSAGQYYSEKVALGAPVPVTTDLQTFVFTFAIAQSASAAEIVTTPGIVVHYILSPL